MHSVNEVPEGVDLPPIEDLIFGRPTSWQGLPIEWSSGEDPLPVFLAQFIVGGVGCEEEMVYLFGARYSLSEALVGGESLGDGHFVEYFVVKKGSNCCWTVHRLLQRESVTFSEWDERQDYLPAMDVADPVALSSHDPPAWDATEAVSPTFRGEPMHFLGQIEIPETDITRTRFTWGVTAYLFRLRVGEEDCFTIVEHETEAQSAEEHYESE